MGRFWGLSRSPDLGAIFAHTSFKNALKCYSQPVPMEIYNQPGLGTMGVMRVTETGWDSEAVQSWMVKYTGNYRNNLVWAGEIGRIESFENSQFKVQNSK